MEKNMQGGGMDTGLLGWECIWETKRGFCPCSMAISGFTQSLHIIYTHGVAFKVLNTSSSGAS